MFKWLANNKELLIAIFGAGGAGAVLITAFFAKKGSEGGAKPPGVTATASNGGIAISHGGEGNIDVRANEAVGRSAIESLQQRFDLSLTEAAGLLKAFNAAGFSLAQGEAAVTRIAGEADKHEALITALRNDNAAGAAAIVARAGGHPDERSAETRPHSG